MTEPAEPNLQTDGTPTCQDPLLGTVFDHRYEISASLGTGATGTAYKARDKILRRDVAIKIIHSFLLANSDAVDRFKQESITGTLLCHPNIAGTLSSGLSSDGRFYTVMELLEGETLAKILARDGRLDLAGFFNLFSQVLDAMRYAHEKGIVHRDLKPNNIVVVSDAGLLRAMIVDFGIAKILNQTNQQNATATGRLLGSSEYMSPEQCSGGKVDARSDIYSLGCIMHECLTGRTPFQGESPLEVMYKHMNESLSKLQFQQALPKVLAEIISKCLQKKPEHRYQNLAQLQQNFKACLEHEDTLGRRMALMQQGKVNSSRGRAVILLFTCLLVPIVGVKLCQYQSTKSEDASSAAKYYNSEKKARTHELPPVDKVELRSSHPYMERLMENYRIHGTPIEDRVAVLHRWISIYGGNEGISIADRSYVYGEYINGLWVLGKFDEARYYLKQLAKIEPTSMNQTRFVLVDCDLLRQSGDASGALSKLDSFLKQKQAEFEVPADLHAKLIELRAKCYENLGNLTKAAEAYSEAIKLWKKFYSENSVTTGQCRLKLITCLAKMKNPSRLESAIQAFLQELISSKEHPRTISDQYLSVGNALREAGDYAGALKYFEKALTGLEKEAVRSEQVAETRLACAQLLSNLARYDEAVKMGAAYLESLPKSAVSERSAILTELIQWSIFAKMNDKARAFAKLDLQEFEESPYADADSLSKAADPNVVQPLCIYSRMLSDTSSHKDAEKFLQNRIAKCKTNCPARAEMELFLAQVHTWQGCPQEALNDCSKELAFWTGPGLTRFPDCKKNIINEKVSTGLYLQALALIQLGRNEEAIASCKQLLQTAEKNHWARNATLITLAQVYENLKRNSEALDTYRKLEREIINQGNEFLPESRGPYREYGAFLSRSGHFAEAEQEYKKALAVEELAFGKDAPETLADSCSVAETLFNQKQYAQAVPLLRHCLQLSRSAHDEQKQKESQNTLNQCYLELKKGKDKLKAEPANLVKDGT